MITLRIDPTEFISIVPPRIAEADSRLSLDQLRARFARNEGLPFADVLTESRIRDTLDEHGVRYRDRLFNPVTTTWGFLSQVLSDDHSCRDAVVRIDHRPSGGQRPGYLLAQHGQLLQRPRPPPHRRPEHTGAGGPPRSCRPRPPPSGSGTRGACSSSTGRTSPCPTRR